MPRLLRAAAPVLLLLVTLAASCIRLKQRTILLPDGSGRIEVSLGVRVGKDRDPPLGESASVESATERAATMSEGLVAITDVKVARDGDWQTTTFTGWFEDVNRLRFGRTADRMESFRWQRDGAGWTLDVTPATIVEFATRQLESLDKVERLPADEQAMARKMQELSAAMLLGLEIRTELRLPGPVTAVEGLTRIDDRTVGVHLVQADLTDAARLRALTTSRFRARCGPSSTTQAEEGAFRADLARAKAAWASDPASRVAATERVAEVELGEHASAVVCLPDGRIVSHDDLEEAVLVRDASGKLLGTIPRGPGYADDVLVSPDGRRVTIVFGSQRALAAFDLASGAALWESIGEARRDVRGTWEAAQLRDGSIVLVKEGVAIDVLDGAEGKLQRTLPGPWDASAPVASTEPGRFLLTERPGRLSLVDAATGARVWTVVAKCDGAEARVKSVAVGSVRGPVFALYASERDAVLVALEPRSGHEVWALPTRASRIAASPSGRWLVLETPGRGLVVDAALRRVVGRLALPAGVSGRIEFGADERTLRVFDRLATPPRLHTLRLVLPADAPPPPDRGR